MNYGLEKPGGFARAAGFALAGLCGGVAGFFAELVATAFADTLAAALPSLGEPGRIALYVALSTIPAAVFAALLRSRRALASSRVLAGAALLTLGVLVTGELTRTIVLDRSHAPFYIVPEVQPAKP